MGGAVFDFCASPIAPGLNAGDFGERTLGCYVVADSSPLAIMADLKRAAALECVVYRMCSTLDSVTSTPQS